MRSKASGFYADSLEMLLDTMCNVLGGIIFITLTLAVLARNSSTPEAYQKQGAQLTNELTALTSSNVLIEAEIQEVLQKLQDPRASSETNLMRLPNLSSTTKKPWHVIVRYGRIYPLNFLRPDGRPGMVKNTRTLDWRDSFLEPRFGQGDDPVSGVEEMVRDFRNSSQTNFIFAFSVYEDSFSAFNRAKEAVAHLGMQYGWEPLTRDTQLTLTDRGSGILPQN